jgi:hypothetical protein
MRDNNTSIQHRLRRALSLGALVVAGLLVVSACADNDAAGSDPAAAVDRYIAAYNSGDVDAAVSVFVDDAVITGHPYADRTEGRAAIRALTRRDIGASDRSGGSYEVTKVEVTGNIVTWDHIWHGANGNVWAGFGNEAVVEGGEITIWAFAPTGECIGVCI